MHYKIGITLVKLILKLQYFSAANNDFEHGFGLWTNPSVGDKFDWMIGQGSTGTLFTGPSNDHTFGSSQGKGVFF